MPAPAPAPGQPPEASPVVIRDAFPVQVTQGAELIAKLARVVVTRRAAYVYTVQDGRPALLRSIPYVEGSAIPAYAAARRTGITLVAEQAGSAQADPVTVVPLSGCGCGNPLKRWQPWAPYTVGRPA